MDAPAERKKVGELRSQRWFKAPGRAGLHKNYRMKQAGFAAKDFQDKPVIGILSTWSDFNTCHAHFPERVEAVKRGVYQAGGFPAVIPVQSVSESFVRPTSMLHRNFLAMEVEEAIRAHPIDGVVLLGGCDKTTPGTLMGAFSMDVPTIFVPAGAMLRGNWHGHVLGTGSSHFQAEQDLRAGRLQQRDYEEMAEGTTRSTGTCNTMGTASTMMSLAETLGLTLPGASSIPSVDAHHPQMASDSGRRIVGMVFEDLKPSDIVTDAALKNAITADMALSGSTNSLIHLIAMARRLGRKLTLDDFAAASNSVPVICNLMPSGKYRMEDSYYAGGLPALLKEIGDYLDLTCMTVNGRTLGENIADAEVYNPDVIRPLSDPVYPSGGLVVLKGTLAPRGAVLKRAAADQRLVKHTGPAIVFKNRKDMLARIDDPNLPVTPDSVLVMQDAGPIGAPGMPEWLMSVPKKVLAAGAEDIVRISDGRMSGTSFGTVVLHVSPESRIGGPLALVKDGDLIRLDADAGILDLLVPDDELERRRKEWVPPPPHYERGYGLMFSEHVMQADDGADFDFLARPGVTAEPDVH